jgi:hypothetical protein
MALSLQVLCKSNGAETWRTVKSVRQKLTTPKTRSQGELLYCSIRWVKVK